MENGMQTIGNGFDSLDKDTLKGLQVQFKDNQNVLALVNASLATIEANELEEKKRLDFEKSLNAGKLTAPPSGVYNVYGHYGEIEIEDKSQPKVEIEIVKEQAILDSNGNITTPAVMGKEMRHPKIKAMQWIWVVNHVCKGQNGSQASNRKSSRQVHVFKHNVNGADIDCGIYPSSEAFTNDLEWVDDNGIKHKGVSSGKDSATRTLARYGYYVIKV